MLIEKLLVVGDPEVKLELWLKIDTKGDPVDEVADVSVTVVKEPDMLEEVACELSVVEVVLMEEETVVVDVANEVVPLTEVVEPIG